MAKWGKDNGYSLPEINGRATHPTTVESLERLIGIPLGEVSLSCLNIALGCNPFFPTPVSPSGQGPFQDLARPLVNVLNLSFPPTSHRARPDLFHPRCREPDRQIPPEHPVDHVGRSRRRLGRQFAHPSCSPEPPHARRPDHPRLEIGVCWVFGASFRQRINAPAGQLSRETAPSRQDPSSSITSPTESAAMAARGSQHDNHAQLGGLGNIQHAAAWDNISVTGDNDVQVGIRL